MRMMSFLNRAIHGAIGEAQMSHDDLKAFCKSRGKEYKELSDNEARKLLEWIRRKVGEGFVWEEGKWIVPPPKDEGKMPAILNKLLHKEFSHASLEKRSRHFYGKPYKELTMEEGWEIYRKR